MEGTMSRSASVLRLAVVASAFVLAGTAVAAPALGADRAPGGVKRLWSTFPLGPTVRPHTGPTSTAPATPPDTAPSTTAQTPASGAPSTAAPGGGGGASSGSWTAWLAALAAALVAGIAAAAGASRLLARRRARPAGEPPTRVEPVLASVLAGRQPTPLARKPDAAIVRYAAAYAEAADRGHPAPIAAVAAIVPPTAADADAYAREAIDESWRRDLLTRNGAGDVARLTDRARELLGQPAR
jgi:hypothetical protein